MKALKRILGSLVICLTFVFALASCSKVNENYANKVNDAYKNGTALKYEDVKNELGDACIDVTVDKNGLLIAVKGMNQSNYKEKLEKASNDEKFDFISITVVQGNCTYAYYATVTASEIKAALIVTK